MQNFSKKCLTQLFFLLFLEEIKQILKESCVFNFICFSFSSLISEFALWVNTLKTADLCSQGCSDLKFAFAV